MFNWILPQGIVLLDDIIWKSFTLLLVISLATCKVLLNIAIFLDTYVQLGAYNYKKGTLRDMNFRRFY